MITNLSGRHSVRRNLLLAVSLSLLLFATYLLTYRGGFHSIDEVSMFAVTENLVKFGQVNTDQIAWTQWTTSQREAQGFFGTGGHVYSKKGVILSLAMAPLYWLGLTIPGIGMLQTASLINLIVTAATMGLLFLTVTRLGFDERVALGVALVCGLGTISWVYSKYLFSEPLTGCLLLATTYLVIAFRQPPCGNRGLPQGGYWHTALAGILAGLAIATRANNLFIVPVFVIYLWAVNLQPSPLRKHTSVSLREGTTAGVGYSFRASLCRRSLLPASFFLVGLIPPALLLMGYNWLRSGNPFQTGYDLTIFSPDLLGGLYKLLFSPLRGLFIYSPVLILSLPGLVWLWKRRRAETTLIVSVVGITLLLFAAWTSGEGLSWGSRFLVPLVPLLCLPLAPVVERALVRRVSVFPSLLPAQRSRAAPLLPLLLGLGIPSLAIQVLGVAINPWVYLGQLQADFGGEFFLERTAALVDLKYTQIFGQLQSWSLANSDVAWWQPWTFDGIALGMCLALLALTGWNLARLIANRPFLPKGHASASSAQTDRRARALLIASPVFCALITFALLSRYFVTDRQFGPPDDPYTVALNQAAAQASPDDSITTVAAYHYHVPMNRFKLRIPLIGFARQVPPLPETALPLLSHSVASENAWLVTVGFPPAAPDNEVEHWLALNAFKVSDVWLADARLVRYASPRPIMPRPIGGTPGSEVQLVSVSLPIVVQPGRTLPVEFVWRSPEQPRANYNVFLQLLGADGLPVVQHDGPPNGGYAPTSTWPAGAEITDRHGLAVPFDLSPGDYRLVAGLVDPTTGYRLPVGQGHDFWELGLVTVKSQVE